ncbi:uncharacterized protein LOC110832469 isoform X3 [Zootermopsis nevadensis]|uniref:uncharacterized protein LOC110832469 isoform X3 n=1 Tax=Zootermopsis nevadensis TaxID=136037 RepID=UPI000B8EBCC7|nr:uncharacterized protein LOC110832469 isoform X3 [Zootermopsis nevadensis]XP_021925256.1 uncharacterized protein LOC110832469 isoform X3 [Zootermopsis nevadensis]XP_021925265.1 uncharacterized protein LOC110832469 isoform X3 [Zootermopsis nevadensis]XP_021925273.1 uncharacterized protein LOC110832469 isoform X3 [Zootermopsis nevadensis]XP_021925281.1 uncharacterized protein LOC110832469 isoform X3 [Zootermopsis nevadensis]
MDDPPPPEYESPMTPLDGSGTELQEPYTSYTPYSNQPATPLHTGCPSSPVTTSVVTVRRGDLSVEEPKQRRPGRRPISELMAEDENSCITLSDKGNGYSTGEGRMCILVYRQKIRYAGAAQVKIFVISICQ